MVDTISHEKRMEVARLYLLGYSYAEVEKRTEVSHGSISNIIKEFISGQLTIPGVPSEKVNDLHQLSVELEKKNMESSQALLGITMFERFTGLGIEPSQLDQWSKLVKIFAPDDFPAKDFFEAVLHLHKLEETEGKPFQEIAQEYTGMLQKVREIGDDIDMLDVKKKDVTTELESLTSELDSLVQKKEEATVTFEAQCVELEEARLMVAKAKEEHAHLSGEIEDLLKEKDNLQSELGTKEESLIKLKKIGLSGGDLLHLMKLVKGMAEENNVSADQIKEEFFSSLDQFKNYAGLHKAVEEEGENLQATVKQKAFVMGEIEELENRKTTLQAEVENTASGAADQIRKAGEKAVSLIHQKTGLINKELMSILEKTLVAGLAMGEMMTMQKQGENAGKELEDLVREIKRQLDKK